MLRVRTAYAVAALPTVTFELTGSAGGRAIAASILNFCGGDQAQHLRARSLYVVPDSGQPFRGRAAHSRRNAVNRVRAAGVRISLVAPQHLAADSSLHGLGICPDAPQCEGLTLVALDPCGLLLAIRHLHVDGPVAELRQAVQVADNPLTGPVRFALFAEVVAELAARDVRFVVVFTSYLSAAPGLRTYQHLLGFQPVNLRVRRRHA